jgi:hypothetical protein
MTLNAAPHDLLRRLLASRGGDKDAAAWVAGGLAAWLRAGGAVALPRCLGLAPTPRKVQLLLRDAWIREAASHIDAPTDWKRACLLAEEIERFESRLWLCWRGERLPPARARPVEASLFFARQHGPLPETARQVRNILGR